MENPSKRGSVALILVMKVRSIIVYSPLVRESQSRLYWPKMNARDSGADPNYSSRDAGRSLHRNDHVSFGDINGINQASG